MLNNEKNEINANMDLIMNNKKKIIWFLNQNSYLPEDGPHIRHFAIGKYLARKEYEPFVFAANELHHNGRKIDTGKKSFVTRGRDGVRFLYIKTHRYEKNDIHRVINILSYYFNLFKVSRKVEKKYGKPDVIYASCMYPTALIAGNKLAKKYGVKCIAESRDIIPEGFITKGTLKEEGLLAKFLTHCMKRIYYRADALVFTMSGGKQYVLDQAWDKQHGGKIDINNVFYVNNGVDFEEVEFGKKQYVLEDEDLDNDDCFKVVYFGAIRFLNQMPLFIETAKSLKKKGYSKIKILMWGSGTKFTEMKAELDKLQLNNIVLKGYVDKKYIPGIASRADLFIGTGNSCVVGKYGMSFNKLFDYLAGGKPIILPFSVADSIVAGSGAGTELEQPTGEELAKEIIRYAEMPKDEYLRYCERAISTSKQFDYEVLSEKVDNIIKSLL